MNDLVLISTDDHICEPPTVFDHAPVKYRDRLPKVRTDANGIDAWEFNGRRMPNLGLNAVVGRRPEEYGVEPTAFKELRKGCYDVHARIADMDVNGVLAALNFPQFTGLAGQAFLCEDRDLTLAAIKAYNDWHIDEWCGAYPGRFIPAALIPHWWLDEAVKEIRRVAAKGCHSINMLPVPNREGFPSWNSGHWDPVLAVCEELGVVINLHINDAVGATPSPESPVNVFITNMPVSLFNTASDILWSPITRKFPNLRFALSEGGAGWVGHFKERADFTYRHHGAWTHQDFGGLLPSEVFDRHFYTCFIQDEIAVRLRDRTGIDNMTWECDYPHSDTTWPRSPECLWPTLNIGGITDEEIDKITHLNAMRLYRFDPFVHLPRPQATVGALRARAGHVDLSFLEVPAGIAATNEGGRVPTMGDMARRLAEAYSTKNWAGTACRRRRRRARIAITQREDPWRRRRRKRPSCTGSCPRPRPMQSSTAGSNRIGSASSSRS
ncbi:MAG: amidohydrolase family protein [Gammaproteobacteria bacterium]